MMLYVDPLLEWNAFGYKFWCHLGTDQHDNLDALHTLAVSIGLKRTYFQNKPGHPHYDLAGKGKRNAAIRCGALDVDHRIYVEKCSKNFRDLEFTEDEKAALTAYRRSGNVTQPHLSIVVSKLYYAGYRLDALSEAWSKPIRQLEALLVEAD